MRREARKLKQSISYFWQPPGVPAYQPGAPPLPSLSTLERNNPFLRGVMPPGAREYQFQGASAWELPPAAMGLLAPPAPRAVAGGGGAVLPRAVEPPQAGAMPLSSFP
jgi:hypothetical protein